MSGMSETIVRWRGGVVEMPEVIIAATLICQAGRSRQQLTRKQLAITQFFKKQKQ